MMTKVALTLSLSSFAACATGSTLGVDRAASRHGANLQLEMARGNDAASAFPEVLDPRVPSVDRIGREIYATLGDKATASLDLCITPAGEITKLELAQSSSMPELDTALLADARHWRFASLPGPDSVRICDRARVTYRPAD